MELKRMMVIKIILHYIIVRPTKKVQALVWIWKIGEMTQKIENGG